MSTDSLTSRKEAAPVALKAAIANVAVLGSASAS